MKAWLLLAFAFGSSGCVNILASVAKPTALERQLLGVYDELDRSLVLSSSVRQRGGAFAERDPLRAQAIEARRRQRFNEDDVDELGAAGCLGEALDGTMVQRPCDLVDAASERTLARVVSEESAARRQIWAWAASVLAQRDGRSSADPAEVGRMYHRLLREGAKPGAIFEVSPGVFRAIER